MKRFSWLICCLLTIVAHARIMEICKIDEICPHLDEDSLVIFDVDLVLVQPKDPAFQLVNMVKHRNYIFYNLNLNISGDLYLDTAQ